VFTTEKPHVYCAVGAETLNVNEDHFMLQRARKCKDVSTAELSPHDSHFISFVTESWKVNGRGRDGGFTGEV
jgi:hypothetical protein